MDYFVSAEDTCYHHWQLELLIESFKLNNLQDSLVIGIAKNSEEKLVDFSHNLRKKSRIFTHENLGRAKDCLALNRSYGLYTAIANGLIKQPFTLIDPDMVLIKPVQSENNIEFQVNSSFVLSSVMSFNSVPNEFFAKVTTFAGKASWSAVLQEFKDKLSYKPRQDLEMTLLDNNKTHNFIHYDHGLPPVFSKLMYKFKPPEAFVMGNLFESILQNNPTSSTNYFQDVVRSYRDSQPKQFYPSMSIQEIIVKSK